MLDNLRNLAKGRSIAVLGSLPDVVKPHFVIRRAVQGELLSRNQKVLNWGGTSTCMATQLAYIMGASEVHLYGVEFSNDVTNSHLADVKNSDYSGSKYFYEPKLNETGRILPSQRLFFDRIIHFLKNKGGMPIYSHGFTNLQETIKFE